MKRIVTLISFVFFTSLVSFGQISMSFSTYDFYYFKNIQKLSPLSEKTLVVKYFEYSKSKVKKMNKKGTYEQAKINLKAQNEAFLKLTKENWKLNEKIVPSTDFSSEEEYSKNDKYIVLEIESVTDTRKKGDKTYSFSYSVISVRCAGKWLHAYSNTGGNFSTVGLVTALDFMQDGISAATDGVEGKEYPQLVNKNASELKDRVLLIPENYTKMTVDEIKAIYPYKFELVSIAEIEEHIQNKDSGYAYYWAQHETGSCGKGFHHGFYACEDYRPLLLIKASSVKLGNHGGNSSTFFEIQGVTGTVYLTKIFRKSALKDVNEIVTSAK